MGKTRRMVSAFTVAAVAGALTLGSSATAQAASGVDLHLQPTAVMNWANKDKVAQVFTISNDGVKKSPNPVTFTFDYQLPVQPAQPTNGGFRNMAYSKGPAGTTCTINQTKKVAVCKLPAIAAGKTVTLTLTSVADNAGAKTNLFGSYYSEVKSTAADDNAANNVVQGGWVILQN